MTDGQKQVKTDLERRRRGENQAPPQTFANFGYKYYFKSGTTVR